MMNYVTHTGQLVLSGERNLRDITKTGTQEMCREFWLKMDNSGIVFMEISCESLLPKITFLPVISEVGMAVPYVIST
jgi:hypothetical protein